MAKHIRDGVDGNGSQHSKVPGIGDSLESHRGRKGLSHTSQALSQNWLPRKSGTCVHS